MGKGEGGRGRSEKNGRVSFWVRLGFSLFAISLFRFSLPPFPPDPAITISFTVFVVIGATSVVFVTTFIIITYITAALISRKTQH